MRLCKYCNKQKLETSFYSKFKCRDCRNEYIKKWRLLRGDTKYGTGNPRKNLIGQRFGSLVVTSFYKMEGGAFWNCLCDCGVSKHIRQGALLGGATTSCGCLAHPKAAENKNWKGYGDISSVRFGLIKRSAKNRGYNFTVTIEYLWELFLKQNKKCALSGIELYFQDIKGGKFTASLDRIDSSIGYVENNLQWVHTELNILKGNMANDKFINWCKMVSKTNQ